MLTVTRGTSPGDSDSASSVSNQKLGSKRRTRASKPKVRTGCITCKIRRVKCDEGKPACARCTSTGRQCDGYDTTLSLSRPPSSSNPSRAEEAQRGAEQARRQFLREYSSNAALQNLRPLVADIEGTETERSFFHHFRSSAAADDFHAGNATESHFWTRVAPDMARRDGAVKHALIALGAAYRLFQQPSEFDDVSSPPPDDGTRDPLEGSSEDLELFTIQQYNHSIALLNKTHASCSNPDSIRVTLVCCLAFIFLEMLRSKDTAALTHLTNGLRILESLPHEAFNSVTTSTHPAPGSDPHMGDIIRMFCRLECSAALFATGVRPSIALRAYHQSGRGGISSSGSGSGSNSREISTSNNNNIRISVSDSTEYWLPPLLMSVDEVRQRCNKHACHVIARMHETRNHYADAAFWSDPYQRRQHEILCTRSRLLRNLVTHFVVSQDAPSPETAEAYALDLDLLHLLCFDMFTQAMTGLPDDDGGDGGVVYHGNIDTSLRPSYHQSISRPGTAGMSAAAGGPSSHSRAELAEILTVATRLAKTAASVRQREQQQRPQRQAHVGFTHEAGILPPLYLLATIAEDPAVRQAALDLLKEAKVREGFWDGPSLYRLVLCVGDKVAQGRWPFHVVPSTLTGLGAIPDMWRLLERMDLEEDGH